MHSSFINKKPLTSFSRTLGSSAIVLVVAVAGFAMTSNVFAADTNHSSYLQLAAMESSDKSGVNDSMDEIAADDESEIGSVVSFDPDSQLGSFSMEDGSMVGVYGDGEYGDD